jgi:hypothetical protein
VSQAHLSKLLSAALPSLEPVDCNGSPLLQPGPEPLNHIAVVVDPGGAGGRYLIGLGWDERPSTQAPDVLAEAVAGIATIRHNPAGHTGQLLQERDGLRQFMRLTGCNAEGNRQSLAIGNHASLGAISPTRPAKRLTMPLACGRQASTEGSSIGHCASVGIIVPSQRTRPC